MSVYSHVMNMRKITLRTSMSWKYSV